MDAESDDTVRKAYEKATAALQEACTYELDELRRLSAGPVDPSVLTVLGDDMPQDDPAELWSPEAFDRVEEAVRAGDSGVTVETLTLYLGKYLVEQAGGTWAARKFSPEGWSSTRLYLGIERADKACFTPIYSWAEHVVDDQQWLPLRTLLDSYPPR